MKNQENKKDLRLQMKELRNAMDSDTVEILSNQICRRLLELPDYQEAEYVLAYFPANHEVSLLPLMTAAIEAGKRVYLPRVEKHDMEFYPFTSMEDVKEGYMGIYEPVTTEAFPKADQAVCEKAIILMPGVVFDQDKNRLGYGGGYYDRYLSDLELYRIAVCYDFQVIEEELPVEPHDVKPQLLVTDKRYIF
jgi:5-formyltetrahydrofolate cyclo-ligase